MKKMILSVVAVTGVALMAFRPTSEVLPIGAAMPKADVKMKNIDGKEISMKEVAKTNGVLVMFSCNTCPYVIKNQERTIAACDFAQKMEVGVIILNSNEAKRGDDDSYEAMKKYYEEQKYNWAYTIDNNSEIADAFGANRTPECYLFNKDLKLVYHGAIDNNPNEPENVTRKHLQEAITELAAGKEISVKESRSVGCTIKRKS